MKTYFVITCLLFSTISSAILAQDSCKVLVKNLQGTYSGDCKEGLAHGKGTANGVDTYIGSFKKGYPYGNGRYIWSSGAVYEGNWKKGVRRGEGKLTFPENGKVVTQDGIWRNDEYKGPKIIQPKVISKSYISSVSFVRLGDGNSITIRISLAGMAQSNWDLEMTASSGIHFVMGAFAGFQNVSFPFTCKLSYKSMNASNSGFYDRRLQFEVQQPGNWEVRIDS